MGLAVLTAALMTAGPLAAQPVPADPAQESGLQDHILVRTPDGVQPAPQPQSSPRIDPPRRTPADDGPCCIISAGTPVAVELTDPVGTKQAKSGDAFALRLAAPVIVDGEVVLPAGTPGVGRVVQSAKPGFGGKGAKLVISAEYLTVGGRSVPLQGLKLAGNGKDNSMAANAAGVGGIVFMPLAVLGFAIQGGDIQIPAGAPASAKIGKAVDLRPVAAATAEDYDRVRALLANPDPTRGWIDVAPPPRGMGLVVFFRPPTPLGTGQWFNVRESERALGKLTNGAYFVTALTPGQHSFTATTEPEFKDHLDLKIDPGEIYYVEGGLTKGIVIGVANLTPSDKTRFDAVSSTLQPAPVEQAAAEGPPPAR